MKLSHLLSAPGSLFLAALLNSCMNETPLPSATNVVAVAGNGMAVVSWRFPAAAIRDSARYSVFYVDSGNVDYNCYSYDIPYTGRCEFPQGGYSSIEQVPGSSQYSESDTVYGLTNGQTYFFTVTGFTAVYEYANSYERSNPVTPMAD